MAQVISLSAFTTPIGALARFGHRAIDPVDPEVRNLGPSDGPEAPVAVEFVGISMEQQRAALAAFPGGRRFKLLSEG